MRVLAIDHGEARCGAAVSDPSGTLATPLDAIEPPDPAVVARLARELDAERVVVGLPVSLDGAHGPQARTSEEFADRVRDLVGVPVETYDERFTTRMADASARDGASGHRDSIAAAHLLESYLTTLRPQSQ